MEGLTRNDDERIDVVVQTSGNTDEIGVISSMGNIDTESVKNNLISTMDNIESQNSFLSTACCIFKTPEVLYRNNKKAYLPIAFSFGPLHHRNFTGTEKIKLHYMRGLINRISNDVNRSVAAILKDLVQEIAGVEEAARQCYAVPVDFTRDQFVNILLVDGCFIIELFRRFKDPPMDDDPVLGRACMRSSLSYDLFLLENQVPWMVLARLFRKTSTPGEESLIELAVRYFDFHGYTVGQQFTYPSELLSALGQSKHLLELCRRRLVWSTTEPREDTESTEDWEPIPSASSLNEAGIKLMATQGEFNGLLDINFNNGVLHMPTFHIQEHTEIVLRNCIAFEQCYHDKSSFEITARAMLIGDLVSTTKDVDILRKSKIIQTSLNPEEAAQTFNKLCYDTGMYIPKSYLAVCTQVNKYCKRRWPRWRAMYVRKFSSPWAIASQVLAAVLFILTFLQTLFTIKK